jgi:hypothetical protein
VVRTALSPLRQPQRILANDRPPCKAYEVRELSVFRACVVWVSSWVMTSVDSVHVQSPWPCYQMVNHVIARSRMCAMCAPNRLDSKPYQASGNSGAAPSCRVLSANAATSSMEPKSVAPTSSACPNRSARRSHTALCAPRCQPGEPSPQFFQLAIPIESSCTTVLWQLGKKGCSGEGHVQ